MGAVSGFIKYSMLIFNFVFWVCGCVILGVSIYVRVSDQGQKLINAHAEAGSLNAAANLMIAVGAIIMVLGFLGCCGAMRESRCMLLLFFIGLLLIVILQIAAGVVGVVYKSQIEEVFRESFEEQASTLSQDSTEQESFKNELADFQKQFKCCGLVNGAADWGKNFDQYGSSCECINATNTNDVCVSYNGKLVYKQTCGDVMLDALKQNLIIVAAIAFAVAVIEILGLVFSMVLYCQIGRK
ncbi:tetraspanin-8 [Trichosurus vulpecula]|uniref:tetraspanin-8 n=1 Tax=Trichosurus vulpecula TaxID=9337 RepID=UPI00186B1160|nr:tetraspanin-8 [Trichosurus vulpecula]